MTTPTPDSTAMQDGLHDLLWRVRLSALYHLKRERFLDGVDRASSAVAALGGAAAFASIQTNPDFGQSIAGFIAIISAGALVYGPAAKARRHSELARDYRLLEADVVEQTDWSADKLAKFNSRYSRLEASEPAALGALVTQCHNELAAAQGSREHITPLRWYERLLKNWFDFDQSTTQASNL